MRCTWESVRLAADVGLVHRVRWFVVSVAPANQLRVQECENAMQAIDLAPLS